MGVQQRYGNDVTFVGVPGLASASDMPGFVSQHGAGGFSHIPDPDGVIWRRFGVTMQRTYVLINDDGSWRKSGYGNLENDVLGLINQ